MSIIENNTLENNINIQYPIYELLVKQTRLSIVFDLNGVLIYLSHLIDANEIIKYSNYKNFLMVYKDFDMNLFIIFYRNYLKEFLIELNNYYDIYIYSSQSRLQTDLFITCIIHLIGANVFKKIFIKQCNINKNLSDLNLDPKYTVIVDIYKNWIYDHKNLLLINIFRGPYDINYDNNIDLLTLKKYLIRLHKLFIDNSYDDITNYIND